jgi:hypothetical protein
MVSCGDGSLRGGLGGPKLFAKRTDGIVRTPSGPPPGAADEADRSPTDEDDAAILKSG